MERLDDSDPGLAYTPPDAWFIGGGGNEYKFTTHGTRNAGAQMHFVFAGNGVDVYGTISHNSSTLPALNRFILDGGDPVSWSAEASPTSVYNTNMFKAHGLQDGTYTLIMEVLVRDSETWIDYLEVSRATSSSVSMWTSVSTPGLDTATKTFTVSTENNRPTFSTVAMVSSKPVTRQESESSITSDTRSTTTGTSSSTEPTLPATACTSLAPASTTHSPVSDTYSIISPGAVAGISVGGTSALVLALLTLLFCLRRRRVSFNADPSTIPRSSERFTGIRPFLLWDNEPLRSSATMGNLAASNKRHPLLNGRSHRFSREERTYQLIESPPSYVP
ncbi:hypothetical protein PM082_023053 [Marasmius tenuissimus]|nr:hypothetical protein PM082_023053 [Marasmius tenuissimus]